MKIHTNYTFYGRLLKKTYFGIFFIVIQMEAKEMRQNIVPKQRTGTCISCMYWLSIRMPNFFFIIDENWHFAMNAKREGIGKYMETMGKS